MTSVRDRIGRRWLPAAAIAMVAASIVVQIVGVAPWDGALWAVGVPLLLSTFPDGRFVPRWTAIAVAIWLGLAIIDVASDGRVVSTWWWTVLGAGQVLFIFPAIYRYRRRLSTEERERVRWGLLGVLLGTAGTLSLVVSGAIAGGTINDLGPVGEFAATVFLLLYPLGFAIGLVRPRLVDVDAALRASLLVVVAAVTLAVTYGLVSTAAVVFGAVPALAGWLGAAAVGIAAVPTVRASALLADWIIYRDKPDPAAALNELGRRLDAQSDPSRIPETLVELVSDALGLDTIIVTAAGLETASLGDRTSATSSFDVSYQGATVATLDVSPRAGESTLTSRDREVLDTLATHAAPAIHGAQALAQLVDARSRVVHAREEERKSLRRDLHDDLAPTLAGLGLTAAGISQIAKQNGPGITIIADGLMADIRSAISQTREIAYGLRPPILDDHGLAAAIRDRTRTTADLRIDVHSPPDRLVLPAAVELAALRIVQEAVLNVRKHADAGTCRIDLEVSADTFEVRVVDDGRGITSHDQPGIGLSSIRERAAELGGQAWISRDRDGGTEVRVRLPLLTGTS